jgi:signal transduction protein with GAF and PtsI domain
MVSTVDELADARHRLDRAIQLAGRGRPAGLQVGIMVEVPAAALKADAFAPHVDFFSVGTNDLTQYTLAVDRGNARLADRFTPHHPAVVRQLKQIIDVGTAAGLPVSVCGEMASEPLSVVLLIGLGYRSLSVGPPALPLVKWVVRTVPEAAAREAAEVSLRAATPDQVLEALRAAVSRYVDLRLLDPHAALPGRARVASLPPDSPLL